MTGGFLDKLHAWGFVGAAAGAGGGGGPTGAKLRGTGLEEASGPALPWVCVLAVDASLACIPLLCVMDGVIACRLTCDTGHLPAAFLSMEDWGIAV